MQTNITHRNRRVAAARQGKGTHPIAQHRRLGQRFNQQAVYQHRHTDLQNEQRWAYFVTIYTEQNRHFFGTHVNNQIRLSELGCMAQRAWHTMAGKWPNLTRGKFIVMPNHIHAIMWCTGEALPAPNGLQPLYNGQAPPQLADLIGNFKQALTEFLCDAFGFLPYTVWQEEVSIHAIRTQQALEVTQRYIFQNPQRWHMDYLNDDAEGGDPLFGQLRKLLGVRDTVPRELHRHANA